MRPGDWICSKCGFILHKVILSMSDGEVYVDSRLIREECPNDGTLLVPDDREPEPDPEPHTFIPLSDEETHCSICLCREGAPWHRRPS